MKKLLVLSFLLVVGVNSFGQQASVNHWTDSDLYKKSKRQKTGGWIFTGVGTAVLLTTLVADAFSSALTGFQESADGIAVPYLIGAASVSTGIGFFVASGKNKKKAKAASVFIQIEKAPVLHSLELSDQSFPALGLKIDF